MRTDSEWQNLDMRNQPVLFHLGDILAVTHNLPSTLVERPPLPNGETVPKRQPQVIPPPLGKPPERGPDGKLIFKPYKPRPVQYSTNPFSVAGYHEIINHLVGGTSDSLASTRVGDDAREILLEALPFLKEIKPPVYPDGMSNEAKWEFLRQWLTEQEKKYGSWHPVSPLENYERRTPEQEMEYIGADPTKLVGTPMDREGKVGAPKQSLFKNVNLEEAMRIGDTEFPATAQAILALSKIGNPPLVIQPEDIKQPAEPKDVGKVITVDLKTTDADQAERKFAVLNKHFEAAGLGDHISLEYDTLSEADSYVTQVNAEALAVPALQEKLMAHTQAAVNQPRRRPK